MSRDATLGDHRSRTHAPGGIDELNGGLGNDRFVLGSIEHYYTVDGGGGIDTVYAQGNDFGYASFVNVETLDVRSGAIALTSAQLAAFATVTDSVDRVKR